MEVQRREFGPILIQWADWTAAADLTPEVLRPLGEHQLRRYLTLGGRRAQSFLVGRWLLASMIAEFTDMMDVGFTTTCERCGVEHGRPRLERAPVAVSVSYAAGVVAAAAVSLADAEAVGVDVEREPSGGADHPLEELAPLFAPTPPPATVGWTLLEAALKADGQGVAVNLARVHVGAVGTGRLPGSHAVRIPRRGDLIDAAVISGPQGFVTSAAIARQGS